MGLAAVVCYFLLLYFCLFVIIIFLFLYVYLLLRVRLVSLVAIIERFVSFRE